MNTSQYSERDRIKLKIKALLTKTVDNGCSEQEAMAAMQGVGRLLTQYNLTMNELDVRDASYKTAVIKYAGSRHPVGNCMMAIGTYTQTKCWYSPRRDETSYSFFGQVQDTEIAEFYFKLCNAAIERGVREFKRSEIYRQMPRHAGQKRSATVSFQHGIVARLCQRLRELRIEETNALHAREEELQAAGVDVKTYVDINQTDRNMKDGNVSRQALIVLKNQLVEQEFKKQVGLKLRSSRTTRSVRNGSAFAAGKAAGDRVNLSRPIGSAPKGQLK